MRVPPTLLALTIAIAGCGLPEDGPALPEPISVGIQAVVVRDDDGGRRAPVYAEEIDVAVAFANRVYEPAAIRFLFDPASDVMELDSTLLNDLGRGGPRYWSKAKRYANEIASYWPDRIVVFYRHGPGEHPTDLGFSWIAYAFVVMPGSAADVHCGERRTSALAHELGHYLGLQHTFPGEPFPTVRDAVRHISEHRLTREHFDGDGLPDTEPDPAIRALECGSHERLVLAGNRFMLPRSNIMSYYHDRNTLSPRQVERARWVLRQRMRSGMRLYPGVLPERALELEALPRTVSGEGCEVLVQAMEDLGVGDWSGDRQLLVRGGAACELEVRLKIASAGTYALELWATRGPGAGVVDVAVDGRAACGPIDLEAPVLLPSGPLDLGRFTLDAGNRSLRVSARGGGSGAERSFGLDALVVSRRPG